MPRYISSLNK